MIPRATYRLLFILLLAVFTSIENLKSQQLDVPLNRFYTQEIERWVLRDSTAFVHTGFKPNFQSQLKLTGIDGLVKDSLLIYNKLNGILYKHHFAEWKIDDTWLAIDPLFDFSVGDDFSDITGYRTRIKFINQRGAQVIGHLGDQVSFQTAFYETQVMAPLYLKEIEIGRAHV